MREVNIGSKKFTKVIALDEPGVGGACHEYQIEEVTDDPSRPVRLFGNISFQNGPIKETSVNGCHHEDLIAIVIDRLESFQKGDFRCRENALAITKLEEGLMWLNSRTTKRQNAGIEGTNVNHE